MIQLFYGIAAMNALFSSMAWCAAKPNRWSILALLTFAVVWPFVPLTGSGRRHPSYAGRHQWHNGSDLLSVLAAVITFIQAIRIRAAVRRNPSVEHRDITEKP